MKSKLTEVLKSPFAVDNMFSLITVLVDGGECEQEGFTSHNPCLRLRRAQKNHTDTRPCETTADYTYQNELQQECL